jgi:hypothetical protein
MVLMQQQNAVDSKTFGWAAGIGLITIGLLLWLGLTAPLMGCGNEGMSPTLAFQSAKSSSDLMDIFGFGSVTCRNALVERLAIGSRADLLLFIPVYSAFLALIVRALQMPKTTTKYLLNAVLMITVVGDVAETAAQLQILDEVPGRSDFLSILIVGNGMKIFGLALFLFGTAGVLWNEQTWTVRVVAIMLSALAVARISGYLLDDIRSLAPLSALGAFVVLWAYAGLRFMVIRRSTHS